MNGLKEPQNASVSPHKSQPPVAEAGTVKYSFPKSQIRVLLLENIHSSALNLLRGEGFQVETVPKSLSEDELIDRLEGVHLLGIRSKTRLSTRVLEAASRLLAIGCFCIGTDQVSLSHAESLGIPVFNAPFSNTRSVAELVVGEIIALSRRLMDNAANMQKGIWQKSASGCTEVRGKVLGIIGYGHIGSQLSVLAENLGMRIIFYDVRTVLPMGNGRAMAGLEDLLRDADFVSLHVPKSNATNGLIGARELSLMKPGAYLINASRGTVVDIDALAHSLKTRHLAGAAVDVFPVEPAKNGPGFESPLRGLENVILTPHIAGSTAEAQRNIGTEVATALIRFVNEGCTASAVNFPQLEMPQTKDCHRILNVHNNVPGVLSAINAIVSKTGSNIRMQILGTSNAIGYTIMDINKEASVDTKKAIKALPESIATRILY